jgi:aspartate racemase
LQREDRWEEATQAMLKAGQSLERAGADFVVIGTNTMHKMADELEAKLTIPLLHIADATAEQVRAAGLKKIGLLGTRFTMEHDFYKGRLIDKFGLAVMIPDEPDRELIHRVIYDELCLGIIKQDSRAWFIKIMNKLIADGAQGIILGCTEIESLIHDGDVRVPLFATTKIHATAAVDYALA